jgi:hypothetical protein
MPADVLDLTAPRRAAMLDRLAELAAGYDVRRLLDDQAAREAAEGGSMTADVMTMRMPAGTLAVLDELLEALADSPEAAAAGGRWGRSAVARVALDIGVDALRARARGAVPAAPAAPGTLAMATRDGWQAVPGLLDALAALAVALDGADRAEARHKIGSPEDVAARAEVVALAARVVRQARVLGLVEVPR